MRGAGFLKWRHRVPRGIRVNPAKWVLYCGAMASQSTHIEDVDALVAAFNPMAPDQIESPYPMYARLRRERPVFYSPMFDLWVVTRYADITEVERDTERFSSVGSLFGGWPTCG